MRNYQSPIYSNRNHDDQMKNSNREKRVLTCILPNPGLQSNLSVNITTKFFGDFEGYHDQLEIPINFSIS